MSRGAYFRHCLTEYAMDKTNPQDLLDRLATAADDLRTYGLILAELAEATDNARLRHTLDHLAKGAVARSETAMS